MTDGVTTTSSLGILTWLITTFLSALFGSAFGGYFGKRGEIHALHEDINKVIRQNEAITTANETIKDELTNRSWDRQRQWEMRRDAVLAVVQSLGRARDALMYLSGMVETTRESLTYEWQRHPKMMELSGELFRRLEEFDEKRLIASFLCSPEFADALTQAGRTIRSALATVKKESQFSMENLFPPVKESVSSALLIARREIGLGDS
jgi:hypothetical protein